MTEHQEPAFLLTPAQRRQWAENARRVNRPDLATHHEQLARAIEIRQWRGRPSWHHPSGRHDPILARHRHFVLPHSSSACSLARACLGSCNHRSRGKSCSKQFVVINPR